MTFRDYLNLAFGIFIIVVGVGYLALFVRVQRRSGKPIAASTKAWLSLVMAAGVALIILAFI